MVVPLDNHDYYYYSSPCSRKEDESQFSELGMIKRIPPFLFPLIESFYVSEITQGVTLNICAVTLVGEESDVQLTVSPTHPVILSCAVTPLLDGDRRFARSLDRHPQQCCSTALSIYYYYFICPSQFYRPHPNVTLPGRAEQLVGVSQCLCSVTSYTPQKDVSEIHLSAMVSRSRDAIGLRSSNRGITLVNWPDP